MKRFPMLAACLLSLVLTGCNFDAFAALLNPTPTPFISLPVSQIILTPEEATVPVGEIITVNVQVINLGMPQYTITLTPGASLRVLYTGNSSEVLATAEAPVFDIISDVAEIQGGQIRLRAVAPGQATLMVSATGEAAGRDPNSGAAFYSWASAGDVISLTAIP